MTLIHPTAIIDPQAQLDGTVQVGPYSIIGAGVKIGANTTIASNVVIEGWTEIGRDNRIFPGAAIGLEPQDLKYRGAQSRVIIGDRNRIREYVTINRATNEGEATIIGNDNLLMAYSHVAHNCTIGSEVIVANGTAMAGHVTIESQATISGVLGIHQFVHIGKLAMIGGMSRINRDVPPYMLVEGNPARVRSLNLIGLKRRGYSAADVQSLKAAFRLIYRQDLTFTQSLEAIKPLLINPNVKHLYSFLTSAQASDRRGLTPSK